MTRPLVTRDGGLLRFQAALKGDGEIAGALNEAALSIRTRARRLVHGGAKSGTVYRSRGKDRKWIAHSWHKASAPGQPPASMTGTLAERIRVRKARNDQGPRKVAFVSASAPHAHLQEFGTVKQSPRPFFGPAVAATRGEYQQLVRKAAKKALRAALRKAKK